LAGAPALVLDGEREHRVVGDLGIVVERLRAGLGVVVVDLDPDPRRELDETGGITCRRV
jgi:hypothetical protein